MKIGIKIKEDEEKPKRYTRKCCYCQRAWKGHPKCRICGIALHRKEYECPECQHPHTLSISNRTCLECILTDDLRISIIKRHNAKIGNEVIHMDL